MVSQYDAVISEGGTDITQQVYDRNVNSRPELRNKPFFVAAGLPSENYRIVQPKYSGRGAVPSPVVVRQDLEVQSLGERLAQSPRPISQGTLRSLEAQGQITSNEAERIRFNQIRQRQFERSQQNIINIARQVSEVLGRPVGGAEVTKPLVVSRVVDGFRVEYQRPTAIDLANRIIADRNRAALESVRRAASVQSTTFEQAKKKAEALAILREYYEAQRNQRNVNLREEARRITPTEFGGRGTSFQQAALAGAEFALKVARRGTSKEGQKYLQLLKETPLAFEAGKQAIRVAGASAGLVGRSIQFIGDSLSFNTIRAAQAAGIKELDIKVDPNVAKLAALLQQPAYFGVGPIVLARNPLKFVNIGKQNVLVSQKALGETIGASGDVFYLLGGVGKPKIVKINAAGSVKSIIGEFASKIPRKSIVQNFEVLERRVGVSKTIPKKVSTFETVGAKFNVLQKQKPKLNILERTQIVEKSIPIKTVSEITIPATVKKVFGREIQVIQRAKTFPKKVSTELSFLQRNKIKGAPLVETKIFIAPISKPKLPRFQTVLNKRQGIAISERLIPIKTLLPKTKSLRGELRFLEKNKGLFVKAGTKEIPLIETRVFFKRSKPITSNIKLKKINLGEKAIVLQKNNIPLRPAISEKFVLRSKKLKYAQKLSNRKLLLRRIKEEALRLSKDERGNLTLEQIYGKKKRKFLNEQEVFVDSFIDEAPIDTTGFARPRLGREKSFFEERVLPIEEVQRLRRVREFRIPLVRFGPRDIGGIRESNISIPRPSIISRTGLISKPISRINESLLFDTSARQIERFGEKQQALEEINLFVKEKLPVSRTSLRLREIPIEPSRELIEEITIRPPSVEHKKKFYEEEFRKFGKRGGAFDVFTRRRKKNIKLNELPLTFKSGVGLGDKIVDNTTAASFFLRKTKGKPRSISGLGFNSSHYRFPKKNSRLQSGSLVEKKLFRINTVGEKKELSVARYLAKTRNKKLLKGVSLKFLSKSKKFKEKKIKM